VEAAGSKWELGMYTVELLNPRDHYSNVPHNMDPVPPSLYPFRSPGALCEGATQHTAQLPAPAQVWAWPSSPQDAGATGVTESTVEGRLHGGCGRL